jgi:hypothetical protein
MSWEWIVAFFVFTPGSFVAIGLIGLAFTRWIEPRLDRWHDRRL